MENSIAICLVEVGCETAVCLAASDGIRISNFRRLTSPARIFRSGRYNRGWCCGVAVLKSNAVCVNKIRI
jgi:hypothetical protein